jgi:aminoglycoside phosphotransferase (APT) family kinase protein
MLNAISASRVFAPHRLARVLNAVCTEVGLDAHDAELLRLAANAVFRLKTAQVVVRISAPRSQLTQVRRTVQVARWLSRIGFPAVRLHGDHAQPVVLGDYQATFWDYLPPGNAQPSLEALARLLLEFHTLPSPLELPRWNPIADARHLLARGNGLADPDRAFLERMCDELDADLSMLVPALPTGVIHGDAWQGNLLLRADVPVLSDLDQVSVGPREWDLVPTIVNALRFGYPPDQAQRFLVTYGFDVTAWRGFPVFRKTRELIMLVGVVPALSSSPALAHEFARRIDGLRNERDEQWTPYR